MRALGLGDTEAKDSVFDGDGGGGGMMMRRVMRRVMMTMKMMVVMLTGSVGLSDKSLGIRCLHDLARDWSF